MKAKTNIANWVAQARKKEVKAMKALYDLCVQEAMASSLRITNHRPDSEDILQEAFLESFQKIGQLKDDEKYPAWVKSIVINKSLRQVRKRQTFVDLQEMEQLAEEEESENWYEEISFEAIKVAIQELPDGCRTIFSLYLLEGYRHREIANMLGIALSTSKSQYRYALRLLREKLVPIHE